MNPFLPIWKVLRYFFNKSEREVRRCRPIVEKINALEPEMQALSDEALRGKTDEFKKLIADGAALDDLLVEAFAVCREAGKRVLNMRHFDVQLIGGIMLHEGKIAEQKTGEGKTLVATLAVYLNALSGKGVHLITVNDYLARRDAEWMGKIYTFLGLQVGVIVHGITHEERRAAYQADITYGTNSEFGFDYLRDNMATDAYECVQRGHPFGIVDEVDSILIDEARTPLIISGPAEKATSKYRDFAQLVPRLSRGEKGEEGEPDTGDYVVDEKGHTVALTDAGIAKVEKLTRVPNWYEAGNIKNVHLLNQALKAHALFKLDVNYVVKDGEVIIVDEFTGRLMIGRRYSEGLHQSIEAKEGVEVVQENMTLATITLQNYFRMYEKLAGMTGTAETEAGEFLEIYKLPVVVIPTNQPMVRQDHPDVIYRTEREKYKAVIEEVMRVHESGQPVLVGTTSIEKSEYLGAELKKRQIPCNVLNAKFHEREATIVAEAGRHGAITIATNMAGRGTDIQLDPEAKAAGGLYILGTERHDARRIDNQLRGRSGRQGDMGESRFFLSLEDDLMRKFGSDRISGLMERLGMEEDVPIESGMVTSALASAQKRVENRNFEIRKHVLKYDDVKNNQRSAVYGQRQKLLLAEDIAETIAEVSEELLENYVDQWRASHDVDTERDARILTDNLWRLFAMRLSERELREMPDADLFDTLKERVQELYRKQIESNGGPDIYRQLERVIFLRTLDDHWKDHLTNLDNLEEGIGLRAYGQKDPLVEFRIESSAMFEDLVEAVKEEVIEYLFHIRIRNEEEELKLEAPVMFENRSDTSAASAPEPVRRAENTKLGRNDPCHCGSGKKFKKCHGG